MRKVMFSLLFLMISLCAHAKSGSSTQVIPSGHWIYDDLYTLCAESAQTQFLTTQPLTVGELRFYFNQIPYDSLSASGRALYERAEGFLSSGADFFPEQELRLHANLEVSPEFYFKSNPDIDWSFAYNYQNPALTIPLIIGFSDYVTIGLSPFLGKNYVFAQEPWNFTNVPYGTNQFEFLTPRFAYGSTGLTFDKWGVSLHVGKEGLKIGQTEFGSIIYNDTFETDAYFQLSLFTKYLKYSMDVVQVSNQKFFYAHQLDLRPFKNLKISVIEGSLLNSSFELRYLNPFMIMHQFGSWDDYSHNLTAAEDAVYGEGHFCAYLAFTLDYVPVKNVRIYALYAQNEILDLGWKHSDRALSVPDSLGGQLGVEVSVPVEFGYIKPFAEAVYTSPYLYVKHSPDWSLYRARHDMHGGTDVSSWMGSPYGPDCFAVRTGVTLLSHRKWRAGLTYTLKMHGENSADMFGEKIYVRKNADGSYERVDSPDDADEIYGYYPSVEYNTALTDEERGAARDKGRWMWVTGIPEISNQIAVNASYDILENLSVYGQASYALVLNSKNVQGRVAQGVELAVGIKYTLLK